MATPAGNSALLLCQLKGIIVSSGDGAPHWRITTEMVRSSFVTINQDRRMASFLAFRRAWCAKQLGVVFCESGAPQERNEWEVIRLIRLCIWLPYHHGTGKVFPAHTQPRGHSGSPPTLEPKHCRIRFGSSNSRNGTLATRAIPQIWRQEKLRWSYPENQTLPLALSANEESISKAWVCRPVQLTTRVTWPLTGKHQWMIGQLPSVGLWGRCHLPLGKWHLGWGPNFNPLVTVFCC